MEWNIHKNSAFCNLVKNIYLYAEHRIDHVRLYSAVKEGKELIPLITTYAFDFDDLSRSYSRNGAFFRDLSSAVEVYGISKDELQDMVKEAALDIQWGRVPFEMEPVDISKEIEDEARFIMDLDAEVSGGMKPTDTFFIGLDEYLILEPCWVPYFDSKEGKHILMPTLIIKTPNDVRLERYLEDMIVETHFISGAFPPVDLKTLITRDGIKRALNFNYEDIDVLIREIDKEIDDALKKHVDLDDVKRILIKRWIEGTYFYQVTTSFPILNIMGPSESGKSRLGLCLTSICYHGEPTLDLTEAGIFRAKEELKPTIVIDEAEYLGDEETNQRIKLLINASYSEGLGYVHRYDEINGARVRVKFNLFSPMVIIAINPLTGITASRSIAINMVRVDKDMPKADPYTYRELRDKLYTLKFHIVDRVWEVYNSLDVSEYVTSRFEELFKPLFVLTKIFGNDKEYKMIGKWARKYQDDFRASAINIQAHRDVLIVLYKMLFDPEKTLEYDGMEFVFISDLAKEIQVILGPKYTPHKVGSLLRSLGFTGRRVASGATGKGGYTLAATPLEFVEATMRKYGIISEDIEIETKDEGTSEGVS